VNVADGYFQGQEVEAVVFATLVDCVLCGTLDLVRQGFSPVLWNPYEMIASLVLAPSGFTGLYGIAHSIEYASSRLFLKACGSCWLKQANRWILSCVRDGKRRTAYGRSAGIFFAGEVF
jgi:hypothetical protein